jgi:hypothetical protein
MLMSEQQGWALGDLPAGIQRRMAASDAAEAREGRAAEAEREARREAAHERALTAFRSAAEARGEYVSGVALATGQAGGRSLADIFAGVEAAADREDARLGAAERHQRDDWGYLDGREPQLAARSSWPGSEFEASRMIERAEDLHRDLIAYQAGRNYPAALEAARAKSEPFVERRSTGRVPMIYR